MAGERVGHESLGSVRVSSVRDRRKEGFSVVWQRVECVVELTLPRPWGHRHRTCASDSCLIFSAVYLEDPVDEKSVGDCEKTF